MCPYAPPSMNILLHYFSQLRRSLWYSRYSYGTLLPGCGARKPSLEKRDFWQLGFWADSHIPKIRLIGTYVQFQRLTVGRQSRSNRSGQSFTEANGLQDTHLAQPDAVAVFQQVKRPPVSA